MKSDYRVVGLVLLSGIASAGCGRSVSPEVPASRVSNLVVIETGFNDAPPASFLLDTGASTSVVDNALAARGGLRTIEGVAVDTGGGSVEGAKLAAIELRIGNAVKVRETEAVAIDLAVLSSGLGLRLGGILGFQVFRQYVVEIDYRAGRVRFHDPAGYQAPGDFVSIPIQLEGGIPFVAIRVEHGGRSIDAKVVLDTGLTGALTLLRPFVEERNLVHPDQPQLAIVTGALLPGKVPASITRVERVIIGGLAMSNVLTNIAPDAGAAGLEPGIHGLIGGELLRRFDVVVVDYSRSRLLLGADARRLQTPMEFDMSGMSLAAQGEGYREYRVRAVVAGSPAAESGIAAGDLLVALDGRPASDWSLDGLRQLFREPERPHVLELRRGGSSLRVSLRTRRLV